MEQPKYSEASQNVYHRQDLYTHPHKREESWLIFERLSVEQQTASNPEEYMYEKASFKSPPYGCVEVHKTLHVTVHRRYLPFVSTAQRNALSSI